MKDKFIGLAQEFYESQYDWRPMEGVRSVRDVFGLIIAECHIFPTAWGTNRRLEPNQGSGARFGVPGALPRAEVISELNSAFDHWIGVVRGMDDSERMAESS